jgi:hypothetical protein
VEDWQIANDLKLQIAVRPKTLVKNPNLPCGQSLTNFYHTDTGQACHEAYVNLSQKPLHHLRETWESWHPKYVLFSGPV